MDVLSCGSVGEGTAMSDAYDDDDDTTEESDRRFIRDFVDLASAAGIRRLADLICNDRKLLRIPEATKRTKDVLDFPRRD